MTPICFIDTETTGLGPESKPWEIAIIRRDEHGDVEHHLLVELPDQSKADPYALRLGGFYERHPQGIALTTKVTPGHLEVQPTSFAARIVARLTHGAYLVGVNPAYDVDVLGRLMRANGVLPTWDYHLVDLYALCIGWLNARGADAGMDPFTPPWPKSDVLADLCGVTAATTEDRHTAMGDARWAMRWYDAITTAQEVSRG